MVRQSGLVTPYLPVVDAVRDGEAREGEIDCGAVPASLKGVSRAIMHHEVVFSDPVELHIAFPVAVSIVPCAVVGIEITRD